MNIINNTINLITLNIPKISTAILILVSFYLLGNFIKSIIVKNLIKNNSNPSLVRFLGKIIKNIFLIIGLVSSAGTLGIDISAMVAGLGLTGFALGFAMKDILSNMISGILILVYRPFIENNFIKVDKYEGVVTEINLRYTIINQENEEILIPNSFVYSKPVIVKK